MRQTVRSRPPRLFTAGACLLFPVATLAQMAPTTPTAPSAQTEPTGPTVEIPPVDVVASRLDVLGTATTASQGTVTPEEIELRPVYRIGQLLESIPGLVVTVHSGEGKANQYLIRGFNLDHGTDFATYVDDMPVNEPTHAHGQGYTDLHFLMPELIGGLDYTKGTFYPEIGDFGAMGSTHIKLADEIPTQVSVSAGTLRDDRVFAGGTYHLDNGDRLVAAGAVGHLDGPWAHPDDYNSYDGTLHYTHGDTLDGFDLTAMAYHGAGNLTTDQPASAYQDGLISRFGTLDPSDGSFAERFSLDGHYYVSGDDWTLATGLYAIRSRLTLWNDFTHYLIDPVNGDQEQQDETRTTEGGQSIYTRKDTLFGLDVETEAGAMVRHDNEYIDRRHTEGRVTLQSCAGYGVVAGFQIPLGNYVCNADLVSLDDVGVFVQNTVHWLPWLRTVTGLREEYYDGHDDSLVTGFSGGASQAMLQPKGSLILAPWADTEFYLSAGQGFHSNDLRGVLGTFPVAAQNPYQTTPLMTRITSEEIGMRSDAIPKTNLTVAVFREHFDSFLTYDADSGVDDAGPPALLWGGEISAQVHPTPWLELTGDFNVTRSRYVTNNIAPYAASLGSPTGLYMPNAPAYIGSFGVIVDNLGPWFGGIELRMLGPYSLVNDNSLRSPGYKEVNLDIGYRFNEKLKLTLAIFNLFNTTAAASQYAYEYQVSPTAAPQTGTTYHPLEPLSARLTLTAYF